jgi:hypothetical protein
MRDPETAIRNLERAMDSLETAMDNLEKERHNSSTKSTARPLLFPALGNTYRNTETAPVSWPPTMSPSPQKPQISRLEKLKKFNATMSQYHSELFESAMYVVCTMLLFVWVVGIMLLGVGLLVTLLYLLFQGAREIFC